TLPFRGEPVTLALKTHPEGVRAQFAWHEVPLCDPTRDIRLQIERFLSELAFKELVPRTKELALAHQIPIKKIVVRTQRSRWGSCSARGTISLNWRLIQTPPLVKDYIIIHEL